LLPGVCCGSEINRVAASMAASNALAFAALRQPDARQRRATTCCAALACIAARSSARRCSSLVRVGRNNSFALGPTSQGTTGGRLSFLAVARLFQGYKMDWLTSLAAEAEHTTRLRSDFPYFAGNLVIRPKEGALVPFKLNAAQLKLHEALE